MGLRSPGSGAGYAPPLSAHDARMDETLGRVEGRGSWPTTEQQVGRQQEGNGYGRHRDFPSGADVLPLLCCFRSDSSPGREVSTRTIDRVRDAKRLLLASTIVQGCEVVDENLARWLKQRAAVRLQRKHWEE